MSDIAVIVRLLSTLFFVVLNFQSKAGNEASEIKKKKLKKLYDCNR